VAKGGCNTISIQLKEMYLPLKGKNNYQNYCEQVARFKRYIFIMNKCLEGDIGQGYSCLMVL
jgi:hypothetical protein